VRVRKHRLTVWLLFVTLVLPVIPGSADEQEEKQEQGIRPIGGLTFVDQIELTIANLVVYVTDKKGNAITDLKKEDFIVFQDGKQREITNFKLYTDDIIRQELVEMPARPVLGPTPTPAPVKPTDAAGPIPVHMVIYIDNENLQPLDRNRVLSQTRDFIRSSLHPPAKMMVVAYQRSFEVLQDFTSDPMEVLSAIRSVRRYTGGRAERERTRRDIIDRMYRLEDELRSSGGINADRNNLGPEMTEVYNLIDNYAKETDNNLMFTLDSMRQIITSLSGLPGKKGIIYVSNGLPMIPAMDLYYELNRITQNSAILTEMYQFDRSRLYQQMASTANAQGVTLYTINAAGLQVSGMGSAEFASAQDPLAASMGHHNLNDSLRFLADETGGIAIIDTNDVGPKLEFVKQDMFTYYSLGYPLQASGQDKVHKVRVKLREDPAFNGFQLRYRSRFVEKSLETTIQDAVVSSLVFEIDDNPMDLDVEPGTPSAASEKRWLMPARITFPLDAVAFLPEGDDYVARVVFFIAARDSDGKQSDLVRREHEIRIPATEYETAKNSRYSADTSLLLESGRYKISVALLDPITRQDSYKTISTSVNPKR
jgi:VWFA-related protein